MDWNLETTISSVVYAMNHKDGRVGGMGLSLSVRWEEQWNGIDRTNIMSRNKRVGGEIWIGTWLQYHSGVTDLVGRFGRVGGD